MRSLKSNPAVFNLFYQLLIDFWTFSKGGTLSKNIDFDRFFGSSFMTKMEFEVVFREKNTLGTQVSQTKIIPSLLIFNKFIQIIKCPFSSPFSHHYTRFGRLNETKMNILKTSQILHIWNFFPNKYHSFKFKMIHKFSFCIHLLNASCFYSVENKSQYVKTYSFGSSHVHFLVRFATITHQLLIDFRLFPKGVPYQKTLILIDFRLFPKWLHCFLLNNGTFK